MTGTNTSDPYAIGAAAEAVIRRLLPGGGHILELGSGSGTQRLADTYRMTSVEHDVEFIGKHDSTYIHAPLRADWYDVGVLQDSLPDDYDLLLVDGPPGDIGRGGLLDNLHLFKLSVPVVVDDVNRTSDFEVFARLARHTGRRMQVEQEADGRLVGWLTADSPRPVFRVISGLGRCGSMWLTHVLAETTPTDWRHELLWRLNDQPWYTNLQMAIEDGLLNGRFASYWMALDGADAQQVGDANTWPPAYLSLVNEVYDIDTAYVLVRDPVMQLDSLWHASFWGRLPRAAWVYEELPRLYGLPASGTRFEILCRLWNEVAMWERRMPSEFAVETLKLEELTGDRLALARLTNFNYGLTKYMEQYINQRVTLDKAARWARWSDDMKNACRRLCKEGAEWLDYEIPDE